MKIMANKSPSHKFPDGNTIAKDSGNVRRKRIRKSALRKTLNKLLELEPHALSNIEKSVKQQEVDKESLNTSRWIVTNLMALTRAAAQDEAEMTGLRLKVDAAEAEEDDAKEAEEATPTSRFSLHVLPKKDDL
jgi:hypothetical protein